MTAVKIKTDVKEGLMQIIRPYLPVETQDMEVNGDSHFINDLKVNSAHMVDIVLDIEDWYDIVIDDEVIGKINTVQDSIDLIVDQSPRFINEIA